MKYFVTLFLFIGTASAQFVPGRYVVVLNEEPAGTALARRGLRPAHAKTELATETARVKASQSEVRSAIEQRGGVVLSTSEIVLNALVVSIPDSAAAELRSLAGVRSVTRVRRLHKYLDQALPLMNIPQAWATLPNGQASAGLGMKVGILDTGIASYHPAFTDSTLTPPSGYPITDGGADANLTTSKIIVLRNYSTDASTDDLDGHGTAVAMCAAGATVTGPNGTITGAAPKAFLAIYKILGSDGSDSESELLQALNAAVTDGVDTINMSVGPNLEYPANVDPLIQAVETISSMGLIVAVADGNEGLEPNTIASPASAPSAIAVGSSRNSRDYGPIVVVSGGPGYASLPSDEINTGALTANTVSGPVADVSPLDGNGLACDSLPAGSLSGKVALIQRGTCNFSAKINNAQAAGATGVLISMNTTALSPFDLSGWTEAPATLPAAMIGYYDAADLKARLAANPNLTVTLTFTFNAVSVSSNTVSTFSSAGPGQSYTIKPDLVAVGDPISTATQSNDSNGSFYDGSGFSIGSGTSFSAPIVAGSVAVLKGARPGLTSAQYRSLIVNSASVFNLDAGGIAGVQQAGAGLLNLLASLQNTIAAAPVSVSFGIQGSGSTTQTVTLSNLGASADTVNLSVVSYDGIASPKLSSSSVTIPAKGQSTVTLSFSGSNLGQGAYQGYLKARSANGSEIHIPYWYAVPSGVPAYIGIINNDGGSDAAGASVPQAITFRITDAYGVPVTGVTPQVTVITGAGRVTSVYPDDPSLPGTYDVDVRLDRTSGNNNVLQITAGGVTKLVEIFSF